MYACVYVYISTYCTYRKSTYIRVGASMYVLFATPTSSKGVDNEVSPCYLNMRSYLFRCYFVMLIFVFNILEECRSTEGLR